MTDWRYAVLVVAAVRELARYDVIQALSGFRGISARLDRQPKGSGPGGESGDPRLYEAMALATCLYWKPVACLQRSVCLVWLLRSHGIPARLVIGYRPVPFFSHAWVEVRGRVMNDSSAYQKRLRVLHTA